MVWQPQLRYRDQILSTLIPTPQCNQRYKHNCCLPLASIQSSTSQEEASFSRLVDWIRLVMNVHWEDPAMKMVCQGHQCDSSLSVYPPITSHPMKGQAVQQQQLAEITRKWCRTSHSDTAEWVSQSRSPAKQASDEHTR